MKTLDEILNESFEQEAIERTRLEALKDPFKKPKAEPGRARPNHGARTSSRRRMTSLGGDS